jgi:hypothetical protein
MRLLALMVVMLLYGCGSKIVISDPSDPYAVAQIATVYRSEGKSFSVPNTYNVEVVPEERFICNNLVGVVGCYIHTSKTIYVSGAHGPEVFYLILVHEYMHAILHAVGDPGWITWLDERPLEGAK